MQQMPSTYCYCPVPVPVPFTCSDGFGGGKNTRITNSYIDTWDDSIKLYKDGMHIENVTIIHNGNGAPFQFGWSNKEPASFTIKNVLVKKGAEKVKGGFNMALFTNAGGTVTPSIQIDGLVAHYSDGLLLTHSKMDKPIPIVYFRGTPKSEVNLQIKEGSVFQVKTGQASYGPGKLLINGQESGLTGIYEQGDASQVTGCGCSEND